LIHLDKRVEHWIAGHRTGWLDWVSLHLSRVGTLGAVWIAIALVLAVLWRRWSLLVLVTAAVLAADGLATLVKALVPRHRPFEHQIGPSERTHSFPSGHASTAFAGATVLASFAPRGRAAFYALAVLIALSRLYNGVHYPTDVIVGAVLGTLTALLLLAVARRRLPRARRPG
jgi:undecaprenyl-diphosphatase